MSGLYQKNYFSNNSSSQDGGGLMDWIKRRNGILIVTMLFIIVAIIIDVTTHSQVSSNSQKAMMGLWAIMIGLFFFFSIYVFGGEAGYNKDKPSQSKWVFSIIMLVFIILDLIWACVLVSISENELSGKEKGILYGRMILLYFALLVIQINQHVRIIRK